jgi:5-methylcytosine-specific restriction endonuclease McrA
MRASGGILPVRFRNGTRRGRLGEGWRSACGSGAQPVWFEVSTHRGGAIEHMRRLATRTQRDLLAILQDYRCAICGSELPDRFDCDHLVPFSKGGQTTLNNLQALCLSCHSNKTRDQAKGG